MKTRSAEIRGGCSMANTHGDDISLDRFLWVQDFAGRLLDLGAPESSEKLEDLGTRLYVDNKELDPLLVAEAVWEQWPTGRGESFFDSR